MGTILNFWPSCHQCQWQQVWWSASSWPWWSELTQQGLEQRLHLSCPFPLQRRGQTSEDKQPASRRVLAGSLNNQLEFSVANGTRSISASSEKPSLICPIHRELPSLNLECLLPMSLIHEAWGHLLVDMYFHNSINHHLSGNMLGIWYICFYFNIPNIPRRRFYHPHFKDEQS